MDNEQKQQSPNLIRALADIFNAVSSGGQGIPSSIGSTFKSGQEIPMPQEGNTPNAPVDINSAPKEGSVTSEGMVGPVATVEEEAEPWQHELARRMKDVAMNSVGPQTANAIANGANPAQIIAEAEKTLQTTSPGQQAMASARQANGVPEGLDPRVNQMIDQLTQKPVLPKGDASSYWLTGIKSPERIQAESWATTAGQVGPTVAQTYMTNQLPLSTQQQVEAGMKAYDYQRMALASSLEGSASQQKALTEQIEQQKGMRSIWRPLGVGLGVSGPGKAISGLQEEKGKLYKETYGEGGPRAKLAEMGKTSPLGKKISYMAGDVRKINGIDYERKENGKWTPRKS
jgi:hypothetical protein